MRIPLIVIGARQVGKTYLIDEFCKQNFKNYYDLFYWSRKGKNNIIQHKDKIIPIKVKSSHNTQAKSLKLYNELYKPELAIRISTNNFAINNNIKEIPLYAVFCIKEITNEN